MIQSAQKLIPAAAYIRMSTRSQQDSPDRQRAEFERFCQQNPYVVVTEFLDHGISGKESTKRKGFQRLLSEAKAGKFAAVIVADTSRFSREEIFDLMQHLKILRDAGVTLVSCTRGVFNPDNLGDLVTLVVEGHGNRDFLHKISNASVGGKLLKISQGHRPFGLIPFGYDKLIIDERGNPVRRVRYGEKFQKARGWRGDLVPSEDVAAVRGVQWAFEAIRDGEAGATAIAREFNAGGLRTIFGKRWATDGVLAMLKNPVYVGTLRAGHESRGDFRRISEQGEIIRENAHPALVDRETFDAVQQILENRSRCKVHAKEYLLSGLIVCSECGCRMVCAYHNGRRGNGRKQWKGNRRYRCHRQRHGRNEDCSHPTVDADRLEACVMRVIRECVLCDENLAALQAARERRREGEPADNPLSAELAELRAKIERAGENLALARDAAEYGAVASVLATWREQERELRKRLVNATAKAAESEAAVESLTAFREERDALHLVPPAKLVAAIHQTIKRILISREIRHDGAVRYYEWSGLIEFQDDCCASGPVPICNEDVVPFGDWLRVADAVTREPRTIDRLAKDLGLRKSSVWRLLSTGERRGRVRRDGSGLWYGNLRR